MVKKVLYVISFFWAYILAFFSAPVWKEIGILFPKLNFLHENQNKNIKRLTEEINKIDLEEKNKSKEEK